MINNILACKPATLSFLTIILLQPLLTQADPVAPDAGQTIRELQQQLGLVPQKTAPEQSIKENEESAAIGDRVLVQRFDFTGNQEIATDSLQLLLADMIGTEHSLSELKAAATRVTKYYRQHNYAVARAYLPAQEIQNGVVSINIIEGRIDKHRLVNNSRLNDERAEAYFDQVKDGDVIKTEQIDRSLLLLNDTPGVGSARATLQPGASVGTSELVVQIEQALLYSGDISLDNYGNRYTGEYRLGGTFNLNSPLRLGDQLTVSALTAGDNLNYGRIAYQLPVGSHGLRVGAAYLEAHYKLGREFEKLDAHGEVRSGSVFAIYPFIRSKQSNLSGVISLEQKQLTDVVDATSTSTGKCINLANLGVSGNHGDTLGSGGISSIDLSLVRGSLDIESASAKAIDAVSARTNGDYTRLTYSFSRLQRIPASNLLSLTISGQKASKNLDSSEKFSLGGINGVRAYPQGEGVGDEGYLARLELRHSFHNNLQGTVFYDTGEVTFNHDPFGISSSSHRHLAGAGIGVNAYMAGFQIRAALAWRTSGGETTSIPNSAANTPNIWVQASRLF